MISSDAEYVTANKLMISSDAEYVTVCLKV
jgi:hypothetical protein